MVQCAYADDELVKEQQEGTEELVVVDTAKEILMNECIEEIIDNDFSAESLEKIEEIADVQIENIDQDNILYTFSEREENSNYRIADYQEIQQYKIVAIMRSSAGEWEESGYNGSVNVRAELYYEKISVGGNSVYKITKGMGKVITNDEKYGKDLKIKLKASGHYTSSDGSIRGTKTQGEYTAYKESPKIGVAYYNTHEFDNKYYYCDNDLAILSLNVYYSYSHNGTKYYTVNVTISKGSFTGLST